MHPLFTPLPVVALLALGGTAFAQPGAPAATEEEAPAAAPAPAPAAPAAAPAAQAPAEVAAEPEAGAAAQHKKVTKMVEVGLSAQDTLVAGPTGPSSVTEAPAEDWGFKFHGYFRGPMRLSMDSESGKGRGIQFHAPPVTPDLNYTTWSYTNNNPGPWAEMLFQYGNNRATMTTAIASYNITSGSWRELQDQLGIDRAFLTLNFPDAFGDVGKLKWDVGVFSNRYGAMGKYDAGAYETYMIGRTRVAGATGTADLDLADSFRLVVESGIGAKMDVPQWKKYPYTSWEPYPGYAQMGTTLLAHAHVAGIIDNAWTITLHAMYTWTKDAMRTDLNNPANHDDRAVPANYASPYDAASVPKEDRDGKMMILGADVKLDGGYLGDGYIGFSHITAANVGVLQDTVEVMHSQGGWQYAANFTGKKGGKGTLDSLGLQYTFSLAALLTRPQAWWGQGADLTIQVFGMLNMISGLDPLDEAAMKAQGKTKLKGGVQVLYTPLPILSAGFRFDEVQPNMDDSTHSFWVLSPRLIFRTEFVTHEQIMLQYQYYSYGSWYNDYPVASLPYPYGQAGNLWTPLKPDKHTFTIAASMWW
jgi:hypothetical protein